MKWTEDSEDADPFVEVSVKYERFYGCSECCRNFISKEKFNEHVPQCNLVFENLMEDTGSSRSFLSVRKQNSRPKNTDRDGASKNIPRSSAASTFSRFISNPPNVSVSVQEDVSQEDSNSTESLDSSGTTSEPKSSNGDQKSSQTSSGHPGLRSSKNKESFECKACNKIYNTKYGFKLHLRTHTGNKGYTCEICGKSFSQSGHLKDHRRIHTGEKPFVCPICDKKFAQNQNLKHHLRMHSGVRPFKCKLCEKTYFTKCELATHERTHSGLKPYQCDSCEKAFSNLQGLKTHLRSHGDDRLYTCPCCKLVFASRRDDFVNHLQLHFSKGTSETQNILLLETNKTEGSKVAVVELVTE